MNKLAFFWLLGLFLGLQGCAPPPLATSKGHLHPAPEVAGAAPPPVLNLPPLPKPQAQKSKQRFSAVVTGVPVKQLLFALARDAKINIDIAPGVKGKVTLNAIDQTLPQILERLARQADFRYRFEDNLLIVEPDAPYFEHYAIPYVNIQRDSESKVGVSNQISAGVTGQQSQGNSEDNESSTKITSLSRNHFWERLVKDLQSIIPSTAAGDQAPTHILAHPESGVLSIKTTAKGHDRVRAYLDQVLERSRRQVLIEATVVEVVLNDRYQAGIDWAAIKRDLVNKGDLGTVSQDFLGTTLAGPPVLTLTYTGKNIAAQVKMLNRFGNTKVISSPRLMVVNNQTAILRVVENKVYFTTTVDVNQTQGVSVTTTETIPHTVPVGFVMSVTPNIDDNDMVLIHVRPTISRITGFVFDPNPLLAQAGTESRVPEIEVQEMESLLKIHDGNIGIIGGLMQDNVKESTDGVPVLARLPGVGDLFSVKTNDYEKSELVVFIRPTVIKNASLGGDLNEYEPFLSHPQTPSMQTQ
ncbi:MAG: hypothetical protein AXA67_07395 [Methylothermaceae bacteria B42]|nr:MAG: hypothetical protein AXA67_07395 [Methylothermaceae bacteria B42]HHJ40150.1 type II and III secretion system protein [Methylothermaceae bacterium]